MNALNPSYMITFLKKTRKSGWMSLEGILLCMTACFHFSSVPFTDLGIHGSSCLSECCFWAYVGCVWFSACS